ncbi:glycosyltransferase family 2 protein [Solirubrobacter soli]|uniref:glycosyltransferase family 2 protein n=1 Tax=Solirubrobacter soli TaxID=363832 RepID=UPI0003F5055C|nr:glycosyltransferase [Solirubrobacter soli]
MPGYAVVVVLHRSRAHLERLLPTIAPDQLIVVDTGPDDGGAQIAQRHGARVIERRDNPGFGAANNEALTHVTQPVTVLLNPDIIGSPHALAQRAQQPGLHAPRLNNEDGTMQRSVHALPGTWGAFVPAISPRAPARATPHTATTPRTVGWAIAAALAAPTQTLRHLGPFDPSIHLFAEDMDLCLRARAQGIKTIFHPDIELTHTGRHSLQTEPFELLARQRRDVIGNQLGTGARRRDDAAQLLTFATRTLAKAPHNDRERAQLGALSKVLLSG